MVFEDKVAFDDEERVQQRTRYSIPASVTRNRNREKHVTPIHPRHSFGLRLDVVDGHQREDRIRRLPELTGMEKQPSFPAVAKLSNSYPQNAGCVYSIYNDLLYGQRWEDLTVLDVPICERGAFRGRRPDTDSTLFVIPCSMGELISTGWLNDAFDALKEANEIYLAISTDDSSIVYYKISRGLVKPPL